MDASKLLENFLAYSQALTESLEGRAEVVGLVFLGSAADHGRVDEWSDHDFFVITKDGQAESLRQDLSWLPRFDEIALAPRETAHGLKVVYEDGQVLEFAVFEDKELEIAAANAFAVAIDKSNIQTRMDAIAARSVPKPIDVVSTFELFLCQLLIGVGRARRGETLIASQHVRSWAMTAAVTLIREWQKPASGTEHKTDNLNGLRRFEQQYPDLGARLEEITRLSVEAAAKELLHLIQPFAVANLEERHQHQIFVIRHRLGW